MPPLPVISGAQLIAVLERFGWVVVRRKGSHVILTKGGSMLTLSVPDHRELDRGILRSILRKAGLEVQQLLDALA